MLFFSDISLLLYSIFTFCTSCEGAAELVTKVSTKAKNMAPINRLLVLWFITLIFPISLNQIITILQKKIGLKIHTIK
jgi:hypothetical protein